MKQVVNTLKQEHPEINTAFFRNDNVGYYHSSCTVLQCEHVGTRCGIRVARIDFSDPQGGKGRLRDWLGHANSIIIRACISEGHDVCTVNYMKRALIFHGGLAGVRVVSIDTIAEQQDSTQIIAGITKLKNFEFTLTDSITCCIDVHMVSVLAT